MLLWLPPALCLAGLLAGCPQDDIESDSIDNRSSAYSYGAYGDVRPENIVFNDFPSTNDEPGDGIVQLVFQDTDGKDHPVIWTNDYHGTRVFGTTFGHGNATWEDPVFQTLLARGLLWAAGREK